MKNQTRRALLFSFLVGLMLLTACSPIQPAATTATTAQLTPLNVCYTRHDATMVVLWYAIQEGIFADYGLDVNLVLISGGGTKLVAAMLAGDVDLCQTGGGPIVNAAVAGADVVMIAGLFNTQLYSLMVRPEIQQPADLKGKTLAVGMVGASSDLMTRLALRHFQLLPDQDVTLVSVGEQSERLAMMASGQVVGTLVNIPETIKAEEQGYHALLDLSTLNLPQTRSTLATTRTYLNTNRNLAVAFLQAMLTATAAMKSNEADSKAAIAEFLQLDPTIEAALIDATYREIIQQHLAEIPYPTEAGIQEDLNALALENPAALTFKPTDFVDVSMLRELEEAGFIDMLYNQ